MFHMNVVSEISMDVLCLEYFIRTPRNTPHRKNAESHILHACISLYILIEELEIYSSSLTRYSFVV